MPSTPFEPVLLNLSDLEDYAVLVAALHDYASRLESDADREDDDAAGYGDEEAATLGSEDLRRGAARARALVEDVERQLDANGNARRLAGL